MQEGHFDIRLGYHSLRMTYFSCQRRYQGLNTLL